MGAFVFQRLTVAVRNRFIAACLLSSCLFGAGMAAAGQDQSFQERLSLEKSLNTVIRLLPQQISQTFRESLPVNEQQLLDKMPANFHHFGLATAGKAAEPHTLTLQFAENTKITSISSTADFKVLPGGSCEEGHSYVVGSACQVEVQFTPQGAGHRLGKLNVETTGGEAITMALMGYSSFPVISFTPSVINTVGATLSSGAGLISGAQNIAIDSGDILYIADTGNNLIRYIDSSGVMRTASSGGLSAPLGITVDPFGEIYFTEPAQSALFEIYAYGPQFQLSGTTMGTCTVASPCAISGQKVYTPGSMATDGYGRIFFVDAYDGVAEFVSQSQTASYAHMDDPFTYQATTPGEIAVDRSDNLYSFWYNGGTCSISGQTFSNSANDYSIYTKIAGGKTCGYSGDGGQSGAAEISNNLGQMAFDSAGNLYFTDTGNNRVRRIDASTGIIHTVAGNGTLGYKGDNGAATSASIGVPTGLAIDSEGQIYLLSSASTGQIVRKVGATGMLVFPSTTQGVASATLTVNVANTGTSTLNFLHEGITGTNAADFTIDANATSCNFAAGNALYAGQSCQIGVIFKPGATGARTATLALTDNTVPGVNKISLTGTGAAAAAVVKFVTPTTNIIAATAKLMVEVTVTSAKGSAPTGKVNFSVDGKQVASGTIASGKASVSITGIAVGTHTLLADYPGDKDHTAAKATETISIAK
jgi:hypothetical protein